MMISAVARDQGRHLDGSTWMFDGSVWTHMPTPPRAGASSGSVVAYDSKRGREVLVMISAGHTQVWEWDGSAWSQHATRHQPQLQSQNASGAYSPKLAATVVLDAGLMPPAATWLYDGTDWRSVATAHQPDAFAHLEFDRTRNSIVALSPSDFRTWQFDGTDWTPLALDGPTPVVTTGMGRQAPWVALDQQRDLWVVFGGFDGEHILSDTWTGNGSGWTKQAPKLSPTTRISIPGMDSLAWDPASNRLVLFGGQASFDGADLDDTWAWDGRSWTQLA
jgi:hypothetical protein